VIRISSRCFSVSSMIKRPLFRGAAPCVTSYPTDKSFMRKISAVSLRRRCCAFSLPSEACFNGGIFTVSIMRPCQCDYLSSMGRDTGRTSIPSDVASNVNGLSHKHGG
jgi:hypothetical protein